MYLVVAQGPITTAYFKIEPIKTNIAKYALFLVFPAPYNIPDSCCLTFLHGHDQLARF